MTVAQKAILSFVLSALLVGGIAVLAYTGVLDLIESRFYNPAASEALTRETSRDARLLAAYLSSLQDRFVSVLSADAVRRSFLPNQSAQDIYDRSRLFGELLESTPALYGVRFVDTSGSRTHFSTHPADITVAAPFSLRYRSYSDDPANLPFDDVYVSVLEKGKIVLDTSGNSMVFSFPLYDSFDVHRGVALFTVSARTLAGVFAASGRKGVGENMVLVAAPTGGADPAGFVDAASAMSGDEITAGVCAAWADGYRSVVPLIASNATFALVSVPMEHGFYFGRIVNDSALIFSRPARNLIIVAIFLTLFLTIFFLLNFRQDSPGYVMQGGVMPKEAAGDGAVTDGEDLEELEAVETEPKPSSGLLATAASLPKALPRRMADEQIEELESVDGAATRQYAEGQVANRQHANRQHANRQYAELEVVSPFTSMFSSLGDPEMLPRAESPGKVIVEQNGVPYINGKAVVGDTNTAEKLDSNFAKLVKSVTGNE